MDLHDTTRAALDSGITTIVRELTESASVNIMRSIASVRGSGLLAYRQGLDNLRSRVPEYENRLVTLHLDLGVRDSAMVSENIVEGLRGPLPAVAISISKTFQGRDSSLALRESANFGAWVSSYLAGVAGRVLVAVERQRRKDPVVTARSIERPTLPPNRTRSLPDLLTCGESPWLDWKREFPAGVIGGARHAQREEHRGRLLKSLVSIANSIVDECGYLAYGVEDVGSSRTVVGTAVSFDDADFQDWNTKTFLPAVHFHYREESYEGKRVALFEIAPSPDYPHVCAQTVGSELYEGQVYFRRGTRNTLAGHDDLTRMFSPPEPLRTTEVDGALVRQAKDVWEPQGWDLVWPTLDQRDEKLADGWRLAHAPGSRREIRLSQGNVDVYLLMMRRR